MKELASMLRRQHDIAHFELERACADANRATGNGEIGETIVASLRVGVQASKLGALMAIGGIDKGNVKDIIVGTNLAAMGVPYGAFTSIPAALTAGLEKLTQKTTSSPI